MVKVEQVRLSYDILSQECLLFFCRIISIPLDTMAVEVSREQHSYFRTGLQEA